MLAQHRDIPGLARSSFCLILDSPVGFWVSIQFAGDLVSQTSQCRPAFSRGRQLFSFRFENRSPVPEHQKYWQTYIHFTLDGLREYYTWCVFVQPLELFCRAVYSLHINCNWSTKHLTLIELGYLEGKLSCIGILYHSLLLKPFTLNQDIKLDYLL